MANRRFIDFPIASTVGDSDIILIWQSGANKQTTKATFLSGLPENLDELNDVTISGLTNGQILRYDSVTGKWENTDQGNLDLNDLNDVSIVSPSNGQVLVYNSSTSKWENSSGGYVPYTGAVTTVNLGAQTIQAGQFVKAGGTSSQFLKADGSVDSNTYGTGSVTSVALTMPSAFNVANSPITTAGTLAVTGAGTVGQYIRGDGSLADFPQASGGGSSVSYYLNGSISQGTIGGVAYKELNKVPILGAGTDFTINADGYIASFLTDAGDPNLLEIPGGNWNFETYFSASSSGGTPTFYVELYKYDGTTFTLIASSSSSPELIAFGTNLNPYFSTLAVPTTTLSLTDRLAVRYYVTHSGRTITLHTENNHLCQVVTTFTTGLTSLNGLTAQVQNLAVGTSGTDFNIASATATHTFNLPTASATNRGALSSADWTTFNNKQNALGYVPVPETRTITINGVSQDLSANRTYNVGTVTSVGLSSATSGVTIGGSPVTGVGAFTLAIATASGSQNGLLSSTDWTTFNNKQNALTNPVTGTGTTNYLPKFTGSTTIGNSQVFDNGTNVGINTNTPLSTNLLGALTIVKSYSSDTPASTTAQTYYTNQSGLYLFGRNSGLTIVGANNEENQIIFANTSTVAFASINTGTGSNSTGGDMYFKVGSNTEAMRIFATTRNVHIGPTPVSDNGARLQVSASGGYFNVDTNGQIISAQSLDVATAGGRLTGMSSRGALGAIHIEQTTTGANGGYIAFRTSDAGSTTPTEKMRIASTGAATFTSQLSVAGASTQSWGGGMSGINIGSGNSSIAGFVNPALAIQRDIRLFNAIYFDGTNYKYNSTGTTANMFVVGNGGDGGITLYNAPSGTSGNNASLTTIFSVTSTGQGYFSGNVGIGTTTPQVRLHIYDATAVRFDMQDNTNTWANLIDNSTGEYRIRYASGAINPLRIATSGAATFSSLGTGTVYSNGGTLTNTNPSDFNLKENIVPINYGLSEILQLNPITFNWKNDIINQGKQYGFIAQEVEKIMPDLVKRGWYLGLDKEAIFTTLVKAIQELKQEIDTFKN